MGGEKEQGGEKTQGT